MLESAKLKTGEDKMPNRKAIMQTNKGNVTIELYEDKAPITTGNFIDLIERGFYDGLKFHRFEPGFVIQGGDPRGNGTGGFVDPQTGRERRIKLEVSPELKHGDAGAVAMARSQDPNSASCQFYITLGPAAFLDMNYAVFGRVSEGMDVVKQLRAGDVMSKVTLAESD
jgi:peptidyl-prolyl cis-trans isomerase B (cyclophilin B)